MSEEYRCCFCRRLPARRGLRGRGDAATRCPVCLGPLIRTRDQVYRDGDCPAGDETPPRRRTRGAYALGGLAGLVAAGVLLVQVTPAARTPPAPAAGGPLARAGGTTFTPTPSATKSPTPSGDPVAKPPKGDPAPSPARSPE